MNARATALGLVILLVTRVAMADRGKAAAAYKEGTAAFARGAFVEAANAFESAFAEDPRAASVYNAALAWQSAHADAHAADDFARAVSAADLPRELLDNAKAQLAKLEATLGRVSIQGSASVHYSVAHAGGNGVAHASGTPPALLHLSPGPYTVHATFADGSNRDFSVDVALGSPASLDLAPPLLAAAPALADPAAPPNEATRRGGLFGAPTLPIALGMIGAGVVGASFSIGFGVEAKSALDTFTRSGDTSQSAHDSAVSNRNASNVILVAALVVGGAGIATLFTVRRVKVQTAIGPGSVLLHGTF
jgi:hypothetical protein